MMSDEVGQYGPPLLLPRISLQEVSSTSSRHSHAAGQLPGGYGPDSRSFQLTRLSSASLCCPYLIEATAPRAHDLARSGLMSGLPNLMRR